MSEKTVEEYLKSLEGEIRSKYGEDDVEPEGRDGGDEVGRIWRYAITDEMVARSLSAARPVYESIVSGYPRPMPNTDEIKSIKKVLGKIGIEFENLEFVSLTPPDIEPTCTAMKHQLSPAVWAECMIEFDYNQKQLEQQRCEMSLGMDAAIHRYLVQDWENHPYSGQTNYGDIEDALNAGDDLLDIMTLGPDDEDWTREKIERVTDLIELYMSIAGRWRLLGHLVEDPKTFCILVA